MRGENGKDGEGEGEKKGCGEERKEERSISTRVQSSGSTSTFQMYLI